MLTIRGLSAPHNSWTRQRRQRIERKLATVVTAMIGLIAASATATMMLTPDSAAETVTVKAPPVAVTATTHHMRVIFE